MDQTIHEVDEIAFVGVFQNRLVVAALVDEDLFLYINSKFKLTDFPIPAGRLLFEVAQSYHAKWDKLPSVSILEIEVIRAISDPSTVETAISEEDYGAIADLLTKVATAKPNEDTRQYIKAAAPAFQKMIRLRSTQERYQDALSRGMNIDEYLDSIATIREDASQGEDESISSVWGDPEAPSLETVPVRMPTGVTKLDYFLGGGLAVEEAGLLFAYTGVGKTTAMCNFSTAIALGGNRCLLIILEMGKRKVKHRIQGISGHIHANLFKLPLDAWPKDQQKRYKKCAEIMGKREYIHVSDLSTITPTPEQIEAEIRKWRAGVKKKYGQAEADKCLAVCIDHLDLTSTSREYTSLDDNAEKLVRMGKKNGVALWVTTQARGTASNVEWLTLEDLYGSKAKAHPFSVVVGVAPVGGLQDALMNTTMDDEDIPLKKGGAGELECNRHLAVTICKNRDNPPRSMEIYQGPTLKLWASDQECNTANNTIKDGGEEVLFGGTY